jgi:hypothetical protein
MQTIALVAIFGALSSPAFAQGSGIYGKGMKIDLGDDKEKVRYIRFITWFQGWARGLQSNPGSTFGNNDLGDDFNSIESTATTGDFLLRRARFLTYSQLTKDVLVMFHAGINNQTFRDSISEAAGGNATPRNARFFVHDVWAEYTWLRSSVIEVSTGFGLHYWNGPVRQSSASTLNFMALDAPISNWPLIDLQDQFARQIGFYVKGKALNKLVDFRAAINRPFVRSDIGGASSAQAVGNPNANGFASQGYVNLQLWDKESNLLPYFVSTYLGKKSVFNIGAGWNYQKDGTVSLDEDGNAQTHDIFLVGGDVFFDSPMGVGALTAYASYYYGDFGPDFLRNIGIANLGVPFTGGTPGDSDLGPVVSGAGNAYPTIGTGHTIVVEAGYAIPIGLITSEDQFQPYYRVQLGVFDALADISPVIEYGFNWHLHGHHTKFTLQHRLRPIHRIDPGSVTDPEDDDPGGEGFGVLDGFANEVIAQVMIWL